MKLFNLVKANRPRRNKFDLSHERKFSFNMGPLVPVLVQDVVPGDSFRVKSEVLLRFAPMLFPIMHRVNVFVHYFFVPNRLVWNEFQEFITGGEDGNSAPVAPYFTTQGAFADPSGMAPGSLADYMGLPTLEDDVVNQNISALPFRAYQLIYDEYYRDQNLQSATGFSKNSGLVSAGQLEILLTTRQRCWEKDYFTSALPWAQRGSEVLMPIGGTVTPGTMKTGDVRRTADDGLATGDLTSNIGVESAGADPVYHEIIGEGEIDSGTVTINELRRAVRLQEWLERNARGGSRYIEQILMHFGVQSSDARLQRPEYLGGGRQPVVISEVLSTAETDALPQGTMAGHGISVGNTNSFTKFFEEHGYVIGIMSVLPKTAYQQGIPRHFQRFDKFDYYWPEFANIGEQEVKNRELFFTGANAETPDQVFGYQSRYAEYKYQPSTVHGDFKTTLNFTHMGRIFASQPSLNSAFVSADPTKRIFAVTEGPASLWCQVYHSIDALRPMPYFGTPTL